MLAAGASSVFVIISCRQVTPPSVPNQFNEKNGGCSPIGWPDECTEPIATWRHFSRQAGDILSPSANLHNVESINEDDNLAGHVDWVVYQGFKNLVAKNMFGSEINQYNLDAQETVSAIVNRWLIWGDVRPALHWKSRKISITPDSSMIGLFGVLACQLMLAISKHEGLACCAECCSPYVPTQRPRSDRKNYCPNCKKAGSKNASAAYRQREKDMKANRIES